MSDIKQRAQEFMAGCSFCVVSTVNSDGKPEAAIVGFSHNDKLELIIGTSRKTRKFANIDRSNHVAVVVGPGTNENTEVQYEGTARLIDEQELESRLQSHFAKLPFTRKYLEDPDQVWFLITPEWLRFTVRGEDGMVAEETREF